MAENKEFELWDTCSQSLINVYRTQSAALTGLYDCQRFGARRECLDLILQRPFDKAIPIASGRDSGVVEWFETMDMLIVKLRLAAGTDLLGIAEFFEYNGYEYAVEDNGGTNAQLNLERYAAIVSKNGKMGEGIGATELEAIALATVQLCGFLGDTKGCEAS